jgi:hypothetical protein
VPESSESGHVDVPDPVLLQRNCELILAELGIPARLRDGANVHKLLDAVRLEPLEELLDGKRGVADGEDRQGFTTARAYARIDDSSASL